ncbi:MAG: transglycosylase domain-containing protein [Alphaproteobacteria bacterium]|nr:transglycosylase domain-containing protein [Alphaproteobacteria bacterium]
MATEKNGLGDDSKNAAQKNTAVGGERKIKKIHWYSSVPKWVYGLAITGTVLTAGIAVETQTSFVQAKIFTAAAEGRSFTETKTSGPDSAPYAAGPYDIRLGYAQTLDIRRNLTERGYVLQGETEWQERKMAGIRLFPIYNEKAQAGLRITDDLGRELHDARFPRQVYQNFDDVPTALVKSLLFVENRELFGNRFEAKNPAIEWERLLYAAKQDLTGNGGAGASTLATQLEKFRHSPGGETNGSKSEKFRQMLTASVRAYTEGPNTLEARQRIALDYINAIPLSAVPGFGEVHGFSDGLKAWFGKDPAQVNALLRKDETGMSDAEIREKALAYRETLSIIMSVKKPSAYFLRERAELEARVDAYLPLLAQEGIISPRLRDATLAVRVTYADPQQVRAEHTTAPNPQKAVTALQIDLLRALEMKSLYELNRLDLTARTTLDVPVDRAISKKLHSLNDPAVAEQHGLTGFRLLKPGQGANITYTFTLYERLPDGQNVLRVQADNFNGQFNLNEDSKLELGSTAKLRTLVSYLEAVADLHGKFSAMDADSRRNTAVHPDDKLTRFVIDHLQSAAPDKSLQATLEAALNRTYSANPHERFFTGGGVHTFSNFENNENGRTFTVKEAFHKSNNLAFVRIMRDVVNYTLYQKMDIDPNIYTDVQSETRRDYLERFADKEGTTFLYKAWQQQRGKTLDETADILAAQTRKTPLQLAVVHRSLYPDATLDDMSGFIRKHCQTCAPDADFKRYYEEHAPGKFNLNDRAYLTRIHPLALWLASHRAEKPESSWSDAVAASAQTRQDVYEWLFKSNSTQGQNTRIRTMLENEAFTHIHATWKEKGFPFEKMTASYASALGSSGDTPAALATLAGIIQNDGLLVPATKFTDIKFGENTPYALDFKAGKADPKRVLSADVAQLVRREMQNVVELGTARRAFGSIKLSDGTVLPIGAKTGTGDNRSHTVTARGGVISSEVKSRTATLVYTIGDRFYGAMTAYVEGSEAADYKFTSGLMTQTLKAAIASEITPTLDRSYGVTPPPAVPAPEKPAEKKPDGPKVAAVALRNPTL